MRKSRKKLKELAERLRSSNDHSSVQPTASGCSLFADGCRNCLAFADIIARQIGRWCLLINFLTVLSQVHPTLVESAVIIDCVDLHPFVAPYSQGSYFF